MNDPKHYATRSNDDPLLIRPQLQPFTGGDLIAIFRRRSRLMIMTVVLVTGLSALIAASLTPHYQAKTSILITGDKKQMITTVKTTDEQPFDQAAIDTHTRLLTSRSFAENVVNKLDLTADPYFNPELRPPSPDDHPGLVGLLLVLLEDVGLMGRSIADQTLEADESADPAPARDPLDVAVSRLLGGLWVRQEGRSSIVSVSFTSPSAELAATMSNSVARLFVSTQLTNKQQASNDAVEWLKRRVEELRGTVIEDEAAIARFRQKHQLYQLTDARRASFDDDEVARLRGDLLTAREARAAKKGQQKVIQRAIESGEAVASISEIMASPVIRSLRERELNLARTEAQLSQEFGPNHPKRLELDAEKQRLNDGIAFELGNIQELLQSELDAIKVREQVLAAELESVKAQVTTRRQADGQAEVQLNELQRGAEANRKLYISFLTQLKELNEQRELITSGARIITKAVTPSSPSFPQPKVITAAGFTISLLLGGLLVLAIEGLSRGLLTAKQVEQTLGLQALAMVPQITRLQKGKKRHHYIVDRPRSSYAEALRSIHVSLMYARVRNPPKTIMLTSSLPGEGKTTMALSLATSLTQSGAKTVLVDVDLRNPSVGKELQGTEITDGLIDYLRGTKGLDDIMRRDEQVPKLDIIPARLVPANPLDYLGSQEMEKLIADLRGRYDYVLLDAPPTLGITDTRIIAQHADCILFVIHWGKTTIDVATNAVEALLETEVPFAGAVLTQVNVKRHARLAYGDAAQNYKKYARYYVD